MVALGSIFVQREYNKEHHTVVSGYLSEFTELRKAFLAAVQ
jgi:hypothetical protein